MFHIGARPIDPAGFMRPSLVTCSLHMFEGCVGIKPDSLQAVVSGQPAGAEYGQLVGGEGGGGGGGGGGECGQRPYIIETMHSYTLPL